MALDTHAQTGRTGRSPKGGLRNFGMMSDEKFARVAKAVRKEANDPEAVKAIAAERKRRQSKKAA